jgi:putative hydrolase of the HAD superfamily
MSKLVVSPNQIDNIIFDFGGVLFNIDYDKPIAAFQELGMNNFKEVYSQSQQSGLFDDLEVGKIGKHEFIQGLKPHFSHEVSDEELLNAWNVILLDIPKERIEKVKELSRDYRTFLLSNTNALHVEEFERIIDQSMGLSLFRSAFEKIYYSNELGMRKPHREIYDHVVRMHDLKPEATLFIDDTIRHVEGARKAGLHAHHFIVGEDEVTDLFRDW